MASAWEPLRNATFRNLFIAQLVSNVGLWMQTVGAQWFLVENHAGPTAISLVQTASLLPTLLFSLLAGVLADILDRKWLLVVMSVYSAVIGAVMAVLAWTGHLDTAGLLILTFLLGWERRSRRRPSRRSLPNSCRANRFPTRHRWAACR